MSKLIVDEIAALGSNTLTVGDTDDTVTIGDTLVVTDTATFNNGITLAANKDLAGGSGSNITGITDITASGTSYLTTIQGTTATITTLNGTNANVSQQIDCNKLEVGDPTASAATGSAVIKEGLTVSNESSAATSVTVSSGIVSAANSEVVVNTIKVGGSTGTAYGLSDFQSFASGSGTGTNNVKAFCNVTYGSSTWSATTNNHSSGVSSIATNASDFSVTFTLSPAISTANYVVSLSGSQDGEDGASSKQLMWYVHSQITTSLEVRLRNAESADTGTLRMMVVA